MDPELEEVAHVHVEDEVVEVEVLVSVSVSELVSAELLSLFPPSSTMLRSPLRVLQNASS